MAEPTDVLLVSCEMVEEYEMDGESIILQNELNKRGIKTRKIVWEDPTVNYAETSLAINRKPSTYMWKPEEYLKWTQKVEETTPLWNSSKVIQWNIHKKYLLELIEHNLPVPETIMIPKHSELTKEELLDKIPWSDFVMKTCICGGSAGLRRVNKASKDIHQHFRNLNKNGFQQVFEGFGAFDYPPGDTLIQEYVPEIKENGEVSLFYFGDRFSHAVSKKPKQGDFRAHSIWGAEVTMYKPSKDEIDIGLSCLDVVGHPVQFARIDYIPTYTGPMIVEVELIDPAFFFDHVPETIKSFADHIENFLNR